MKVTIQLKCLWHLWFEFNMKGNLRDHLRIKVCEYFKFDNIAVTYQDNVKNINQHTCKFLSQE
jgi:hypothetical protein